MTFLILLHLLCLWVCWSCLLQLSRHCAELLLFRTLFVSIMPHALHRSVMLYMSRLSRGGWIQWRWLLFHCPLQLRATSFDLRAILKKAVAIATYACISGTCLLVAYVIIYLHWCMQAPTHGFHTIGGSWVHGRRSVYERLGWAQQLRAKFWSSKCTEGVWKYMCVAFAETQTALRDLGGFGAGCLLLSSHVVNVSSARSGISNPQPLCDLRNSQFLTPNSQLPRLHPQVWQAHWLLCASCKKPVLIRHDTRSPHIN